MRYSLNRSGRSTYNVLMVVGAIAILLLGSIFTIRQVYTQQLRPVSESQRAQLVEVPPGASAKEIAASLEQAGVIRAAWAFEWYVRNHDLRDKLQAGTYYVRPNQAVPEIANILTQGLIATDLITILPAQRLDQIRSALIQNGYAAELVDQALDPSNYEAHPALVDKPRGASLEGYLYPESFHKSATTSPATIIKQSLDEMQNHLTPELRASIVKQGLTVHEGIILASIIEQEVSDPEDKKMVAQVFLRRLRENMALESDPTAIYGAIKDGQKPSLSYDSAYNTYKRKGLPPSPISNVSKASLEAVAYPAQTDYLFFVSGDDGKTHFSRTLSEHEELTDKYCKELCS